MGHLRRQEAPKHGMVSFYQLGNFIGWGFPGGSVVKNLSASAGDAGSIPRLGRFPWGKKWQPTSVFLPGKSYGQRSLVGYSSWGRKGLDTTEHTHVVHNLVLSHY